MQTALGCCAVLALAACARLPLAGSPVARPTSDPPTIVGPHGPLVEAQVKRIMGRLESTTAADELLRRHVAAEEKIAGMPLSAGNEVTLLQDGPETYEAMFQAIDMARDHINAEFYIIEDDEIGRRFADRLLQKRSQGIAIRLIYDSVGSLDTPDAFFDRLRAVGIQVLEFNPVNPLDVRKDWLVNNRDHRKIVVVDGQVAFIGGINISSVYSSGSSPDASRRRRAGPAGWRDTNVRIEGPAVVQIQLMFLNTWMQQNGGALDERNWFPEPQARGAHLVRVIGSDPADPDPAAIYLTLLSVIDHAEFSVHITMAYFVPDDQMLDALKRAAGRGVQVAIVVPSRSDFWAVFYAGRARYAELLDAGVTLYERQDTLLHSKTAVIDGVWSTVGSSNIDPRSFLHNTEINAVILGTSFAQAMEEMFRSDLERSAVIDPRRWQRRAFKDRMIEWAAAMWDYWL